MLLVWICLEVVVRADFLHQPVVGAGEGDEDADDLEGLGADPGGLGLRVFRVAGLSRVIHAGFGLLGPVGSLVLYATVEFGHHHHVPLGFLVIRWRRAGGLRGAGELGGQVWERD